jgi:hypothetical protein
MSAGLYTAFSIRTGRDALTEGERAPAPGAGSAETAPVATSQRTRQTSSWVCSPPARTVVGHRTLRVRHVGCVGPVRVYGAGQRLPQAGTHSRTRTRWRPSSTRPPHDRTTGSRTLRPPRSSSGPRAGNPRHGRRDAVAGGEITMRMSRRDPMSNRAAARPGAGFGCGRGSALTDDLELPSC